MSINYRQNVQRKPVVPTAPPTRPTKSKKEKLVAVLHNRNGRDMAELTAPLGWLSHIVRAAMTGLGRDGVNVERRTANGRSATGFARRPADDR